MLGLALVVSRRRVPMDQLAARSSKCARQNSHYEKSVPQGWNIGMVPVAAVAMAGVVAVGFAPLWKPLPKRASSAESVGAFWLWELTEVVHESQFCDLRGPKTIRLSRYQFHLVVETFNGSRRNLSSGPEPIQD